MPRSLATPALLAGNVVLALALMWTSAQSQTPPQTHDVIRARLIELVNDRGDVVGQLYLGEGGSGIDAVSEILASFDIPVIFITAYPEKLLTGERPEPTYLIAKPFLPETVQATVGQALFFHPVAKEAA